MKQIGITDLESSTTTNGSLAILQLAIQTSTAPKLAATVKRHNNCGGIHKSADKCRALPQLQQPADALLAV